MTQRYTPEEAETIRANMQAAENITAGELYGLAQNAGDAVVKAVYLIGAAIVARLEAIAINTMGD